MAELEGVALISSTMNPSNEWFIDSAATKHMTNDRNILENYVEYDQPKDIYFGDSTVIHALGEGKVRLPTVNSTNDVVLNLHKVLFVPKLTKNLLSVPAMALMRAEIRFDKDKCLVLKDSKEFVIGCLLHDKLYSVNSNEYAQVSTSDSMASPEVWHRRLGHLNYTYMNQLMKKEMVDGMNYDSGTQTKNCKACVLGKMQKKPFPFLLKATPPTRPPHPPPAPLPPPPTSLSPSSPPTPPLPTPPPLLPLLLLLLVFLLASSPTRVFFPAYFYLLLLLILKFSITIFSKRIKIML